MARLPSLPDNRIPYGETELLRRTLANLPDMVTDTRRQRPLYALFAELFQCETRVARALCDRYERDPDAVPCDSLFPFNWRDRDDGK